MAEATTKRLVEKIDTAALHTNVITARSVQCAKLPMIFDSDAEAIKAMLKSLPDSNPAKARVVRIKDPLTLGEFVGITPYQRASGSDGLTVETQGQALSLEIDVRRLVVNA